MALGKLFQEIVAPPSGVGDASVSLATTASGSSSTSSNNNNNTDELQNVPVATQHFYPILEECLAKHNKTTRPADATQALQLLLELVQICTRNIPVTNQLWGAMLDECGLGLIAKQSLVGRKADASGEVVQRTKRDMCMLWCPLELPFAKPENSEMETTLPQLLDRYCTKQPYTSNKSNNGKKKKQKDYYNFDKQPYDFEVKIPTFAAASPTKTANVPDSDKWKTTRSLQLTTMTTYLFLSIQRKQSPTSNNGHDDDDDESSFNHAELVIPLTLDISKLCDSSAIPKKENKKYELVGGVLYDEGDYVPVIRDESRVTKMAKSREDEGGDGDDQDDDEAWKLLETEEVIPMSESDVLEFLKGDASAEGDAPCGTMAIYRRVDTACQDEMNQLLSDIIISQVSGTLTSTADYYIEEEIIDDDEDDDEDGDEVDEAKKVGSGLGDGVGSMETIKE